MYLLISSFSFNSLYLRSLETPWKECTAWNMVNQEASAVKYWYSGELAIVNSDNKNLITQLCQTTKGSETYKAVVICVLTNLLCVFQVSVMYCAYVTLDNRSSFFSFPTLVLLIILQSFKKSRTKISFVTHALTYCIHAKLAAVL